MKRQLQGIAILLCSILFSVTFRNVGWDYFIGGTTIQWQHLFMITGIVYSCHIGVSHLFAGSQ